MAYRANASWSPYAQETTYVGRRPAFQRVGVTMDGLMTPAEARELAFPWEPTTFDLVNGSTFDKVTTHKGIARSDDPSKQLGIVGSTYTLLDHGVLQSLAEAADRPVMAAGTLGGGAKVWMLLDASEHSTDYGGADPHSRFIWIGTSHDGSGSLTAAAITERFYCVNQFSNWRRGAALKLRHSSRAMDYVPEARRMVKEMSASFTTMDADIMAMLKGTSIAGIDGLLRTATEVFGKRPEEEGRGQTVWDNRWENLVEIYRSDTVENIRGTNYATVMTINQHELRAPGRGQHADEAEARRVVNGLRYTNAAVNLALA